MQPSYLAWKKSSYSQVTGHCVEVAVRPEDCIHVRDSTDREGAAVRFGRSEWGAFLAAVREGKFGHC